MLWTNTKRVIRSGFVNFWRNGFVSIASMLVMIITLFVLGSIIFTSVILTTSLEEIKNKVDINVYFVTTASEEDIVAIKKSVETLPEVERTTYQTREQVLAEFRKRHENNQFIIQGLDELQDNPLGAVLNIKAKEPSQYEGIAQYLESSAVAQRNGVPVIDKINYNQNKIAIEKLSRLIDTGQKLGLILTIILATISVIITFNTIRLAIYISREEISIMRLVGASSKYVRGPFVIVGIMYGALSALITMALFYPITYSLGRATQNLVTGLNINAYYIQNFVQIFLILLAAGVIVGGVSSYLAVRRYLKV